MVKIQLRKIFSEIDEVKIMKMNPLKKKTANVIEGWVSRKTFYSN